MVFFIHAFSSLIPTAEIVLKREELLIFMALNVLLFAGGQVSFLMGISQESTMLQALGLTLSVLGALLFYLFFKSPKAHAEFFLFPMNLLGLAIIGIPCISYRGFMRLIGAASTSQYVSINKDDNCEDVYKIRYIQIALLCLVAAVLIYFLMGDSSLKTILMMFFLAMILLFVLVFVFKGIYSRSITSKG